MEEKEAAGCSWSERETAKGAEDGGRGTKRALGAAWQRPPATLALFHRERVTGTRDFSPRPLLTVNNANVRIASPTIAFDSETKCIYR